jgi:hypothetical protein
MKTTSRTIYRAFALVAFAFLAVLPQMLAVSPPPDGCYPGLTTAEGCFALFSLATGQGNTALGHDALFSDTEGSWNTGVGAVALALNDGDFNTAVGVAGLLLNTTGHHNTAVGAAALVYNDSGNSNNAVGAFALFHNIDGFENNAFGYSALFENIHASGNTAVGDLALEKNDSSGSALANNNVAVGAGTLHNNVDGSENTAVGTGAGPNVVTGSNNTYVGDFVGTLSADESNTIRIGDLSNGNGAGSLACFIGGIFNNFQPVGGSVVEVTLDLANDELGWDLGPNQGFSAPVQRSAPLPRARLQRQHQAMLNDKVEKLEATVAQQQKQIEALTSALQKVSAQLEVSKPSPQTVLNNR